MWISDEGANADYFPFKLKINVKNGAKTPSGVPTDYIEFYISFDNDPFPGDYGFKCYKVTGYRFTGFVADM